MYSQFFFFNFKGRHFIGTVCVCSYCNFVNYENYVGANVLFSKCHIHMCNIKILLVYELIINESNALIHQNIKYETNPNLNLQIFKERVGRHSFL